MGDVRVCLQGVDGQMSRGGVRAEGVIVFTAPEKKMCVCLVVFNILTLFPEGGGTNSPFTEWVGSAVTLLTLFCTQPLVGSPDLVGVCCLYNPLSHFHQPCQVFLSFVVKLPYHTDALRQVIVSVSFPS